MKLNIQLLVNQNAEPEEVLGAFALYAFKAERIIPTVNDRYSYQIDGGLNDTRAKIGDDNSITFYYRYESQIQRLTMLVKTFTEKCNEVIINNEYPLR